MSEPKQALWVASKPMHPGVLALQCGLILFSMGAVSFAWDRHLIEGPADEQLVPVRATLLSIDCEVKRGSSQGAAHSSEYGELVVHFEYRHGGQVHESRRYQRQRSSAVGSMAECQRLASDLRGQPSVEAWLDPAEPDFAILSKRLRGQSLSQLFMGIGAVLASVGLYRWFGARVAKAGRDRGRQA